MNLVAAMLCFTIPKDVSLAPLLEYGYSAPTENDRRAHKSYGNCEAYIERVVGDEYDRVFIEVRGLTPGDTLVGITYPTNDLASAGLYRPQIEEKLLR